MAGVEFEEDYKQYGSSASPGVTRGGGYNTQQGGNEPKMVRWLMSHGMSARSAQGVLIGLILINFAVIFFIWKTFL